MIQHVHVFTNQINTRILQTYLKPQSYFPSFLEVKIKLRMVFSRPIYVFTLVQPLLVRH